MGGARLDSALVMRGLARSRTQAARWIAEGRVTVDGSVAAKASHHVTDESEVSVADGDDWASRGAYKLLGALDSFGISVAGKRGVDVGASTGGFTDVLLRRGATAVAAIDVGTGQLLDRLAVDPRVSVHDGVNVRDLTAADAAQVTATIGGAGQIVVADVSFISLTLVLPVLVALAGDDADVLPMVKPQFEVGKGRLGAHGVVRDPAARLAAVCTVADAAADLGWPMVDVVASPLPGPTGNVEYFLHLSRSGAVDAPSRDDRIRQAVFGGPQ